MPGIYSILLMAVFAFSLNDFWQIEKIFSIRHLTRYLTGDS